MSILEQKTTEFSMKIDAEDLEIVTNCIIDFGKKIPMGYNDRLENKMHITLLQDALYKFQSKLLEKRGSKKHFLVKLKPAQAFSVFQLLNNEQQNYDLRSYECVCILKVKNDIHQKLIAL